MGLREIERRLRKKSAFQRKEGELMITELEGMIENMELLRDQLKKFEKTFGKQIKNEKEYYEKLGELRENLGFPEEVGVYEWKDSPSFKDRLTGKGFYHQIGLELLQMGQALKEETGGIISLADAIIRINKIRPGKIISAKDTVRALSHLEKEGVIPGIKELESGVKIIEFVPSELSDDHDVVLSIASRKGHVTIEELLMKTSWSPERIQRTIDALVDTGMARKDESYAEGSKYWFPGLMGF